LTDGRGRGRHNPYGRHPERRSEKGGHLRPALTDTTPYEG
jgi:hypothetical protein